MSPEIQEKIDLHIEMPRDGFDGLALRRLGGLVAAHAGLSLEQTPEDTLRFNLGERAPTEAMDCAVFVSDLCDTAKLGKTALYCHTTLANPGLVFGQRTALEHLAETKGFGNIACYEDDGDPNLTRTHTGFGQLEQDIRAGQIARVLATSVSKLGRNTGDVIRWVAWARRHGAEIFTLNTAVDINAALEALENA